jgi:hypothetical protein
MHGRPLPSAPTRSIRLAGTPLPPCRRKSRRHLHMGICQRFRQLRFVPRRGLTWLRYCDLGSMPLKRRDEHGH